MDAALALLRLVVPMIFGVGTIITILALRRAPEGMEDEDGFHYTRPSDDGHAVETEPTGVGHSATGIGLV